jgi:pimeloyl-ACP methyl ester carboxylesterase
MRRAYIDIPEGQIHYQFGGSGESLLLLHQSMLSLKEYSKMMPLLMSSYHVIAMDTLGYGQSDNPPEGFLIEDFALSVVHFLKTLGISRTSIVGHLTGSAIAAEVAVTKPDIVDKLILLDLPFLPPEPRQVALRDPMYGHLEIKQDGSHMMKIWQFFLSSLGRVTVTAENVNTAVIASLQAGPYDAHLGLWKYEMEKRLPLIKVPTLLVSGTEARRQEYIHTAKELIPRCKFMTLEGGGELIPLEKANECSQVILEFLNNPGV